MKEEKIRVLALLPTEYAKMVTIDNTLEAMQQFVGGLIECLPMDDPEADIVLVCNDEGKLLQLPPNRWLWGGQDLLVGPAFIAAGDEEGNLCSLSDAMLEKYTNLFKEPMFLAWEPKEWTALSCTPLFCYKIVCFYAAILATTCQYGEILFATSPRPCLQLK